MCLWVQGEALAKELAEEEAGEEETDLAVVDAGGDQPTEDKEEEDGEGEWEPQVPAYIEARRLFQQAEVADPATLELQWKVRHRQQSEERRKEG